LQGKDIIALAETGSGKTLAFAIVKAYISYFLARHLKIIGITITLLCLSFISYKRIVYINKLAF